MVGRKKSEDSTPKAPRVPKGAKKSRKTFDIDRTVNIEDNGVVRPIVEPQIHIPVSLSDTPEVALESDKDNAGAILHIPIPISHDSGLIDKEFKEKLTDDSFHGKPEPYDPYIGNKIHSQNEMIEKKSIVGTTSSFQTNQKMENTTLSQFFGISKPEIENDDMSVENIEKTDDIEYRDEDNIIPEGDGFSQTAGYSVPSEAFSIIWRSSVKKGTSCSLSSQVPSVCHWCCHPFNHQPVGVPMQYRRGKFWVRGHYCGYGCGIAAILYDRSKWNYQPNESYALLHLLYRKTHGDKVPTTFFLTPALPRETLQMFGGPLSIDEYRKTTYSQDSIVECFTPPFVSLVSTIEEITIEKNSSKKKVPFHSRFHQAQSTETTGLEPGRNLMSVPQGEQKTRPIAPIWLGQGLGGSVSST